MKILKIRPVACRDGVALRAPRHAASLPTKCDRWNGARVAAAKSQVPATRGDLADTFPPNNPAACRGRRPSQRSDTRGTIFLRNIGFFLIFSILPPILSTILHNNPFRLPPINTTLHHPISSHQNQQTPSNTLSNPLPRSRVQKFENSARFLSPLLSESSLLSPTLSLIISVLILYFSLTLTN